MITLPFGSARMATPGNHAGDATVRQAHYYDAALHRAITESGASTGRQTLERAAASAAYRSFGANVIGDPVSALHGIFADTGLGEITSCDAGPEGATITVAPSGYVRARIEMFGNSSEPVCDVSRGVLSGALGALYGEAFVVREEECVAVGDKACRFVAVAAKPGEAEITLPIFEWPSRSSHQEDLRSEDPNQALLAEDGEPIGPTYGRLWVELYARAAYDLEQEIPKTMGAKFANLASVVLTEAAHLGTFYSVGGLIRSPEWGARVVPLLPSREEWAGAIVRLVDSFGWGTWNVEFLDPRERFTVQVHDGYEAGSYLQLADGHADAPKCYFARGFVGALMNVLFAGDVLSPPALNQTVYNTLFRSLSSFRAVETRCIATGDPFCEFVASPLSPPSFRSR